MTAGASDSVRPNKQPIHSGDLLKPSEVAELFGVAVPTIARWVREGILACVVSTPGGHRRYRRADIISLLCNGEDVDPQQGSMEEDAARLYSQGWSIRQVAEKFDCSYGVMRRILQRRTILRERQGMRP